MGLGEEAKHSIVQAATAVTVGPTTIQLAGLFPTLHLNIDTTSGTGNTIQMGSDATDGANFNNVTIHSGAGGDSINLQGDPDDGSTADIDFGRGTTATGSKLGLGNELTVGDGTFVRLKKLSSASGNVILDTVTVDNGGTLVVTDPTTIGSLTVDSGGSASFEAPITVTATSATASTAATTGTFTLQGTAIFTGGGYGSHIHILDSGTAQTTYFSSGTTVTVDTFTHGGSISAAVADNASNYNIPLTTTASATVTAVYLTPGTSGTVDVRLNSPTATPSKTFAATATSVTLHGNHAGLTLYDEASASDIAVFFDNSASGVFEVFAGADQTAVAVTTATPTSASTVLTGTTFSGTATFGTGVSTLYLRTNDAGGATIDVTTTAALPILNTIARVTIDTGSGQHDTINLGTFEAVVNATVFTGAGNDTVNLTDDGDDATIAMIDFGAGTTATTSHLGLNNQLNVSGQSVAMLIQGSGSSHTVVVDHVNLVNGDSGRLIVESSSTIGDIIAPGSTEIFVEAPLKVAASALTGTTGTTGVITLGGAINFAAGSNSSSIATLNMQDGSIANFNYQSLVSMDTLSVDRNSTVTLNGDSGATATATAIVIGDSTNFNLNLAPVSNFSANTITAASATIFLTGDGLTIRTAADIGTLNMTDAGLTLTTGASATFTTLSNAGTSTFSGGSGSELDATTITVAGTLTMNLSAGASASVSTIHLGGTLDINLSGVLSVETLDVPVTGTINAGSGSQMTITAAEVDGTLTINLTSVANVSAGTFDAASGTVNVNSGGIMTVGGASTIGTLNISGASMTLVSGGSATLDIVNTLSISGTGKLDLTNNDLIVEYSGGSPIGTIRSYLASGYNIGNWNGAGIDSSSADMTTNYPHALGYDEASDLGVTSFDGVSVSNAVLVKYTDYGANTLRQVDTSTEVDLGNDFNLLLLGYLHYIGSTTDWLWGDYNYDGVINDADLGLFIDGYVAANGGAGSLPSAISAASGLSSGQKASLIARAEGLDTTFGTNGKVTTDISTNRDWANALTTLSSGKILAAGQVSGAGAWDFGLVQYNNDGSLDTSFGATSGSTHTGWITTDFSGSGSTDIAYGIVVNSSTGRIYLVGNTGNDIGIAAYTSSGALDTGFGTGGKVIIDINSGSVDVAYAIAIQSNGKIVVTGKSDNAVTLVRCNTDGTLDTAFGTGGIVTTSVTATDSARSLAIQSDGKIVVAANSYYQEVSVLRYNTDGTLDTAFGTSGAFTQRFDIWNPSFTYAVGIQSSGKIVVAGVNTSNAAIMRLSDMGVLDTSFGTGGVTEINVSNDSSSDADNVAGLFIMSDGRLVITGSVFNHDNSGAHNDFMAARFTADGALDTSFAGTGMLTTDFGYRDDAYAVTVDSSGRIILAGATDNHIGTGQGEDFALARYLA